MTPFNAPIYAIYVLGSYPHARLCAMADVAQASEMLKNENGLPAYRKGRCKRTE